MPSGMWSSSDQWFVCCRRVYTLITKNTHLLLSVILFVDVCNNGVYTLFNSTGASECTSPVGIGKLSGWTYDSSDCIATSNVCNKMYCYSEASSCAAVCTGDCKSWYWYSSYEKGGMFPDYACVISVKYTWVIFFTLLISMSFEGISQISAGGPFLLIAGGDDSDTDFKMLLESDFTMDQILVGGPWLLVLMIIRPFRFVYWLFNGYEQKPLNYNFLLAQFLLIDLLSSVGSALWALETGGIFSILVAASSLSCTLMSFMYMYCYQCYRDAKGTEYQHLPSNVQ